MVSIDDVILLSRNDFIRTFYKVIAFGNMGFAGGEIKLYGLT